MSTNSSLLDVNSFARLSELPAELLVKIFFEQATTQRHLRSLRLVCRAIDDVVKHSVVEHIRLEVPKDIRKIEAMTSQPNTFHASTRTLYLDGAQAVEECESWNAVIALIRKLGQIRAIHCIVPGRLSEQMIGAIGELPMLESISLAFPRRAPSRTLRLLGGLLPRLKSLALEFGCFGKQCYYLLDDKDAFVETEGAIRDLIARGTTLEYLEVGPSDTALLLDLKLPIGAFQGDAKIRFSVRTIVASAITLPISPQSTGFFANLSSLDIPNTRKSDEDVWPALQKLRVKLKTIKVDLPSPRLIDYIRNYHGLQSFHLGGPAADYKGKNTGSVDQHLNKLLNGALPEHRTTMVDLRFRTARDPSGTNPLWQESLLSITTDILRPLHRFRNLERLDILYSVVKIHRIGGTTMHYLLNVLAALSTKLRTFWFHFIGVDRCLNPSDNLRRELDLIEEHRFALRPSNWRDLRVIFKVFDPYQFPAQDLPLPVNHVAYQVVCDVSEDTYRLEMDLEMTEILNEPKNFSSDMNIL